MDALVVLVIDDDPQIRKMVGRLLGADRRVEVREAADGVEALRLLEQSAVDVVISDEVMPEINGVRLLETIRMRWPAARRILFTGHPDAEVVLAAINRGGVHKVLVKGGTAMPLHSELADLVEESLDARGGGSTDRAPPSLAPSANPATVLVACDELALQRKYQSALAAYDVRLATRPRAIPAQQESHADVVVLDLSGGTGAREFMRDLRVIDLDCPIVIAAPRSAVDLAHDAMRYGAYRYLLHPFSDHSIAAVVKQAAALRRMASLRRMAAHDASADAAWQLSDRAALEIHYRRALEQLFMVYQPIISHSNRRVMGYEALVRSREQTLPHPGAIFDAARRLDRVEELGRAIRRISLDPLHRMGDDALLFLNLDVKDIEQEDLLEPALASMAERIVLEVTERAALDAIDGLATRISALRARGFRIAVDDLGAGYAGLTSFATLEPDIVKLDMTLVRDIHLAPVKQRLVAGLQEACDDLGVRMVAEGVETVHELASLQAAGCDVFQGYLFARPGAPFPEVSWS